MQKRRILMKKTNIFLVVVTIALAITLAVSLFFNAFPHNCEEYLENSKHDVVSDSISDTTPATEKDVPEAPYEEPTSEDKHLYCYEFLDTAMAHVDWIDGERFLNGYIRFLEDSITASNAKELNVEEYWKMMSVFAGVSETMLSRNDELFDDVVYTSWLNLTYRAETTKCNKSAFASEYQDIIENEVKVLKDFAKNPTVFPFEVRW